MKKLLLALTNLTIISSTLSVIVSCSNDKNNGIKDISLIKKKLTIILQSRGETTESWEEEKLEQAILAAKIGKPGEITVKVGKKEVGLNTEFKQQIIFKGNATNKNNYSYAGEIILDYFFGENLPLKTVIFQKDVDDTLKKLENFLNNVTFNNQKTVESTFNSKKNIPGAPVEGIIFGVVKNLKFSDTIDSEQKIIFSFEANVQLKNEQYVFDKNINNETKTFFGKMNAPVIITNDEINNVIQIIQKDNWIFSNIDLLRKQIKSKIEAKSLTKGIEYNNFEIKEITGDDKSSYYWKVNILISLKPNTELGYKFEDTEFKNFNLNINLITLKNIQNASLKWTIFEQKDGHIIVKPQFIQFGSKIINDKYANIQGNKLINDNWTDRWGTKQSYDEINENDQWEWKDTKGGNNAYEQKTDYVEKIMKNNINSRYTVEQVIEQFMINTTTFGYQKEEYDLFKNDNALFFEEPSANSTEEEENNFQKNILEKINKTDSLEALLKDTTIIKKGTVEGKKYFTMLLLNKNENNTYTTSDKAFRVILNNVKI